MTVDIASIDTIGMASIVVSGLTMAIGSIWPSIGHSSAAGRGQ